MATVVVIAVPWTGGVAQASGLEPGVHADPGSPAAKEYALPLNKARQIGANGSSAGQSGSTLFGAGIAPPGGGGSGSGRTSPTPPSHGGSGSHTAPAPVTNPKLALAASSVRPAGSGGSSLLALVGGGVLVLAIGALGGSALRQSKVRRVTERE